MNDWSEQRPDQWAADLQNCVRHSIILLATEESTHIEQKLCSLSSKVCIRRRKLSRSVEVKNRGPGASRSADILRAGRGHGRGMRATTGGRREVLTEDTGSLQDQPRLRPSPKLSALGLSDGCETGRWPCSRRLGALFELVGLVLSITVCRLSSSSMLAQQ